MEEIIEKYYNRLKEFAKIDSMNLSDRSKGVIKEKQFYSSEWAKSKMKLYRLGLERKKISKELSEKISAGSGISVNKKLIEDKLKDSPKIEEISTKIIEEEIILEILEQILKQVTFIGNDIKNIIECEKLENL